MLPLIIFSLAAFTALAASAQEAVLLDLDERPFPATISLPHLPHLFINGPLRRGAMSIKNGKIIGWNKVKMDARFDPVNEVLYMNSSIPEFKFQGDYTMNLQYFDDEGNATVFHGVGRFDLTYKGYELIGAKYPVRYCPSQRKYQLEYPSYEGKMDSCTGEWTGIVNGLTGQSVTLEQMLKTNKQMTYKKPFFVEIFRAISNAHIRRGYAKSLASGLLNSFLVV